MKYISLHIRYSFNRAIDEWKATLNKRILVTVALLFMISGCTQLSVNPADSPDLSSETDSSVNQDMVSASPRSSDSGSVSERGSRSADISVGVTEEEGSELATILRDNSTSDLPIQDSTGRESATSQDSTRQSGIENETQQRSVLALCREIGNKLGSASVADCLAQNLVFGGAFTVQSRPIVVKDFLPERDASQKPRILIMGGIHGDEYSSISIMFKWMALLGESNNKDFHWRFAPTVNPNGLLDGQAIRQNANGVDLNRNFPSDDWQDLAQDYWKNTTSRNPRRFPGDFPASEPEVQWVVEQINTFKPDVIVSVHAPYHLLDYDGPPEPPEKIGELHLHLLGVYPGSLGNYAGINLGIPVITMELPSAGIMPNNDQITKMWNDLLEWLYEHHDS